MARCDAPVLMVGETGTGKDVFARALHYLSPRSARPFVPLNCGAIPVELVENELFGHEQAAFTGASGSRRGLIAEAEGGTLFLDEIDTLTPTAQVKLLRFLEDREYRPLGSPKAIRADLRLIAASNADLEEALEGGRLRRDLYYRLDVLKLELPPLRQRGEDVVLLARHFLCKCALEQGRSVPVLSPPAVRSLLEHDWPGNVRELEHLVERTLLLEEGATIERFVGLGGRPRCHESAGSGIEPFQQAKARTVADFERSYLERLLSAHDGNVSQAARAAGKHRRALSELIRKHGIDLKRFRRS